MAEIPTGNAKLKLWQGFVFFLQRKQTNQTKQIQYPHYLWTGKHSSSMLNHLTSNLFVFDKFKWFSLKFSFNIMKKNACQLFKEILQHIVLISGLKTERFFPQKKIGDWFNTSYFSCMSLTLTFESSLDGKGQNRVLKHTSSRNDVNHFWRSSSYN